MDWAQCLGSPCTTTGCCSNGESLGWPGGTGCFGSSSCHDCADLPPLKSKKIQIIGSGKFADCPFDAKKSKSDAAAWAKHAEKVKREFGGCGGVEGKRIVPDKKDVERFLLSNPEYLKGFVKKHVYPKDLSEWSKNLEKTRKIGDESEKQTSENGTEKNETENQQNEASKSEEKQQDETPHGDEESLEPESQERNTSEHNVDERREEDMEKVRGVESNKEGFEALKVEARDPYEEVENGMADDDETNDTQPVEAIESDGRKASRSTSTTDNPPINSSDLILPLYVSVSTSTTNALVQCKPVNENPKIFQNLTKLTSIREARQRQKDCVAGKKGKDLRSGRRSRHKSTGSNKNKGTSSTKPRKTSRHQSQEGSKEKKLQMSTKKLKNKSRNKSKGRNASKSVSRVAKTKASKTRTSGSRMNQNPSEPNFPTHSRKGKSSERSASRLQDSDSRQATSGRDNKESGTRPHAEKAASRVVNDAFLDLIVKFHSSASRACRVDSEEEAFTAFDKEDDCTQAAIADFVLKYGFQWE